jgi:hypothetical protein
MQIRLPHIELSKRAEGLLVAYVVVASCITLAVAIVIFALTVL